MQTAMKALRIATLPAGTVEIDIKNAHPMLLLGLAEMCGGVDIGDLMILRQLVERRDEEIRRVVREFGVTRDEAKDLFRRMLYGGTPAAWVRTAVPPHAMRGLDVEIQRLQRTAKALTRIASAVRRRYAKWRHTRSKDGPRDAAFLKTILDTAEAALVLRIAAGLEDAGATVQALVHDAVYVSGTDKTQARQIAEATLTQAQEEWARRAEVTVTGL